MLDNSVCMKYPQESSMWIWEECWDPGMGLRRNAQALSEEFDHPSKVVL